MFKNFFKRIDRKTFMEMSNKDNDINRVLSNFNYKVERRNRWIEYIKNWVLICIMMVGYFSFEYILIVSMGLNG